MATTTLLPFSFQRTLRAVDKVHQRLLRATAALDKARVEYAVVGGNAVAAWVSRVDESAVRYTQDVDVMIRRSDLELVKKALEPVGFVYRHVASMDMFLDGPDALARDAVHLIFAEEKVRENEALPNPDMTEYVQGERFRVITLEALVQIKLTSFRRKDQVHLDDLIRLGLVDETWCGRYPKELSERLRYLIENPEEDI
jgi:hypothetical protein